MTKRDGGVTGVTAFDALDTMLLMGLKDEYRRALRIVENANFNKSSVTILVYSLYTSTDRCSFRKIIFPILKRSSGILEACSPHMPFRQTKYCLIVQKSLLRYWIPYSTLRPVWHDILSTLSRLCNIFLILPPIRIYLSREAYRQSVISRQNRFHS
jgi:hypothetical protein